MRRKQSESPQHPVPNLVVETLSSGTFDLSKDAPGYATLVVFYRGFHCPICVSYLKELGRLTPEFLAKGVKTIAVSSDDKNNAIKMAEKVAYPDLRIGYNLPLQVAKEWGLYLSSGHGATSVGIEEPILFSEPGVFLVRNDSTLYFAIVQTMPFVRPHFKEMIGALEFVQENDYPARGEYIGSV
ncbi:hypothetical protein Misp06_00558 [Microbulbifer sp. NBRC 101763]|uniref:peroxiredoxin-like family protein n=1 Tax=Microbulbifer TaxID=48073 RepID=UPI00058E3065|nr:peroxiredoxin-like family protein [Microbulbifer variabilis]